MKKGGYFWWLKNPFCIFLLLFLKYLSLVFAIIFGFYLFNEVPTIYTLSGAGLIVISSAIIFVREHQLKKPITLPRQQ